MHVVLKPGQACLISCYQLLSTPLPHDAIQRIVIWLRICRNLTKAWQMGSLAQGLPIDVQSALEHMAFDAIPVGLTWLQQHARDCFPRPDKSRVASMLAILTSLLEAAKDRGHLKALTAQQFFVFAFSWGLAGDLPPAHQSRFSAFVKSIFEFLELPEGLTVFDIAVKQGDPEAGLGSWTSPAMMPTLPLHGDELFVPSPEVDCFSTLIQVKLSAIQTSCSRAT